MTDHLEMRPDTESRRQWLAVLARCSRPELEAGLAGLGGDVEYELLKPPETGLIMARIATSGGTGPFNVGEVAVTRCVVSVDQNLVGVGYVTGRDGRKAELAALFDALMQDPRFRPRLEETLMIPARRRQTDARELVRQRAAATRVDFTTLVRGE